MESPTAAHVATAAPSPASVPVETDVKKIAPDVADVDILIQKLRSPILGIDFTHTVKKRTLGLALPTPAPTPSTSPAPTPSTSPAPTAQLLKVQFVDPLHQLDDFSATNLIQGKCCGGGCCRIAAGGPTPVASPTLSNFDVPNNAAFSSLKLKLSPLSSRSRLSSITPLPVKKYSFEPVAPTVKHVSTAYTHPPKFVTPHPPYEVFPAKIHNTRELTSPGAAKRTYHFDLDVTDYPVEGGGVDFRVGGAIGVQAPNDYDMVERVFDLLDIDVAERDGPITLKTDGGRWPTIWGDDEPRSLVTTRRELLTWTVDIQSYPPTKNLLRLMAEYASDEDQKTILLYLCSKQGQAAFCEYVHPPYLILEWIKLSFFLAPGSFYQMN